MHCSTNHATVHYSLKKPIKQTANNNWNEDKYAIDYLLILVVCRLIQQIDARMLSRAP